MLRQPRSSCFLLVVALAVSLVGGSPTAAQSPAGSAPDRSAGREVIEMIVARINNEIVTLSELERSRLQLRQELAPRFTSMQLEAEYRTREKDLLRDLIDTSLLLQKGKEMGISVDTEVVKRMDQMRKDMGLPTMEDFEKAVAAQGLAYEDYKANLRNSLITQQVIGREVGSRVQVTQAEVKKYYEDHRKDLERPEQVHLREILVSTEGKEGPALAAAEAKIQALLARARKGEKFEELAEKESEGASAKNGGDIGFFKRGVMAPEIEKVAFGLKKGQISDVISIKNGLLILKVEDHFSAGVPPLAEVEQELQEHLYLQKVQPALREYMTKLRDEAYLDVKPGYTDTGSTGPPNSARLTPVDVPPEELTTTVSQARRGGRKALKPWTWPRGSKPPASEKKK